ncbi:hypothetical protein JTE90_027035 [Oedothorax gibbosus]|uniref:Cytochrome b5 n=1 Tax=Oedothorax gibbosus TaxID=931172 RepID=A0AAV6UVX9_9ARAC|nr:hypothetical protein JTE90_027035 [Oedothorax gibbosus]
MSEGNKKYTLEEIEKHNDKKSVWILIHGNVYDVTKFLEEHPGGEEVLLDQAEVVIDAALPAISHCKGKHALKPLKDIGTTTTDARDLMKQYKIGELCDEDKQKISEIEEKNHWPIAGNDDSSWKNWLIPIAVAILASILYRFYISSQV